MERSRRNFLKIAGASAVVGLGTHPVLNALAAEEQAKTVEIKAGDKALHAKQWGMVIDTRKLTNSADLAPRAVSVDHCRLPEALPKFIDKKTEVQ